MTCRTPYLMCLAWGLEHPSIAALNSLTGFDLPMINWMTRIMFSLITLCSTSFRFKVPSPLKLPISVILTRSSSSEAAMINSCRVSKSLLLATFLSGSSYCWNKFVENKTLPPWTCRDYIESALTEMPILFFESTTFHLNPSHCRISNKCQYQGNLPYQSQHHHDGRWYSNMPDRPPSSPGFW